MSFLDKVKASAQQASAATSRAARRTKLKGEIMMLQQDIAKLKKEFGLAAYDFVIQGDLQSAQRVANEKSVKIEVWAKSIEEKRAEIKRLNDEAAAAGEKVPPADKYQENNEGEVVI